jgi:hypothetical protein
MGNAYFVYEPKNKSPFVFDFSAYKVERELETTREKNKISLKQYSSLLTNKAVTANYVEQLVPRDIDKCVIREDKIEKHLSADLSSGVTVDIDNSWSTWRDTWFMYPTVGLFYIGSNGNNWWFDTTNSQDEVSVYVNSAFAAVGDTSKREIKVEVLGQEVGSGLGDKTLSINANIVRRLIKYGMLTIE